MTRTAIIFDEEELEVLKEILLSVYVSCDRVTCPDSKKGVINDILHKLSNDSAPSISGD